MGYIKKRKNIKKYKVLSLLLVFMVCVPLFISAVAADDEDDDDTPPDAATAIAENYWAELEGDYYTIDHVGIYPKYLMKLEDSLLKNIELGRAFVSVGSGVYKDYNTLFYVYIWDMFDDLSRPELHESDGPHGDPNYQENKWHNPFNFSFDTDFIRERDELNVYADIAVNGNTENTSIATHSVGEELTLDFSVDLSNLSKFQNSRFFHGINGMSMYDAWRTFGTESYRTSDSELVFILNIPEGITAPDTNNLIFDVEGLNNIKFKSARREGNKLIITVHPYLNDEGYMTAQDYHEYLRTIKKVSISVKGLSVNNRVTVDSDVTVTGSVAGVNDVYATNSEEAIINKVEGGTDSARTAYFFVGKQSNAGRDFASPQDKPNLISYTFRVAAPEQLEVKFINEDNEYARVRVEKNYSINSDSLTEESMPQNPVKDEYNFKEWNTSPDGSGTVFKGDTVVKENITVYAIYTKNAVATPTEATPTEATPTDATVEEDPTPGHRPGGGRPIHNGGGSTTAPKGPSIVISEEVPKQDVVQNIPELPKDNSNTSNIKVIPKTDDNYDMLKYFVILGVSLGYLTYVYKKLKIKK